MLLFYSIILLSYFLGELSMSIESDLKKDGIEVIEPLDTLKINTIARNISIKICETFPEYGINQNDLFIKLSRLNMYRAKMPERNG